MGLGEYFRWVLRPLAPLLQFLLELWRLVLERVHLIRLGAKFPGPFSWPIVGNSLDARGFRSEDVFDVGWNYCKQYYPLFRAYVGPWLLILSNNALDNEVILSGYKTVDKSYLYNLFLGRWLGNGLLISRGDKWRSRRKMLTPAFHFRILEEFVSVFHSCGDAFVKQLRTRAGGDYFDAWPLVKLLTLDVICETAMGVQMNAQSGGNSDYVNAVNEITNITLKRVLQPWYAIDSIFYLFPLGRRYKKNLEVLHGTTRKIIRERTEELKNISATVGDAAFNIDELGRRRRVAFLDLLLMMARDGNLSDADIQEEVDTFMFEGHDTTSAALSFTIFLLSRHEEVQEKILEELKSTFDWTQPLHPSIQQLSDLKYMEMVIKECLRLYPPVGLIVREVKEDVTLPRTGHVIPKNSMMFPFIYGIHRNPEVFPDPEKFDPERFTAEASAKRHPYAYIPFSAGPRNCIGQRFAMLEMKSLVAKLVWNFHILPEPGFEPIIMWEIITKSKNGVRVRLEDRRPQ